MIYIKRSDGIYCSFQGMTEDQITVMLADQGLTCEFINQSVYETAISK